MIEFQDVSKVYQGKYCAVDHVSFKVLEGQIACLIGPSGCGKTTLLRMVNGLTQASGGTILVDGVAVQECDPIELRRSIGYVIQQGGLLPHLNIMENITILLRATGVSRKESWRRGSEVMELVHLNPSEYAGRFPRELSGGEQQRIVIARALVANPKLLLMDEPFGALDIITRRSLQQECLEMNQRLHKTVLMVTHDLAEAFRLGDQIILMNEGKIVQAGAEEELMRSPQTPFVKRFIDSHLGVAV